MKSQRKLKLRVGTHVCPSSQASHRRGPFQTSDTYTDPGKAPRAPWTLEFRPPCLRLRVPLTPQRGGPKSQQLQRKGKQTSLWPKRTKGAACPGPTPPLRGLARKLTFLHHADVNTALEPAGLAVTAVVFGDAAVSIEGTGEQRLPLHAPPAEREQGPSAGSPTYQPLSPACMRGAVTLRPAGQAPSSKTPRENRGPGEPLAPLSGHPCPTV